ncbi:hypothetical protein MNBD_GAMMA12-3776 [hydrothermal vent metagenome]|uniref:Uncharacterized protein n=1 Tax=hydrothermal vent metagenome TaxID=652676 RepID=A0A3B0YYE7_9ZZZZ
MYRLAFKTFLILNIAIPTLPASSTQAEIEIKMDTTIIKGNTELPKILYIVPWREIKHSKQNEQQFVIHSLYGDLFNPVPPK